MTLCALSSIVCVACAYLGEYQTAGGFAMAAIGFGVAYSEVDAKEEAWNDYELVEDTANIMWENEDLAHRHTAEISNWLHGQTFIQAIRYVRSFTNHDIETFKGKEQGSFEWILIRWYPYDWTGICILICY